MDLGQHILSDLFLLFAAVTPGVEAARAALVGAHRAVAELGLIFLLFFVSLETRLHEIFRVGAAGAGRRRARRGPAVRARLRLHASGRAPAD